MSDLPKAVSIQEEGPREGFQISAHPIATAQKIRLVDALSGTGLREIQCASFVNPKRVPNWADAEEVARGVRKEPGVRFAMPLPGDQYRGARFGDSAWSRPPRG